MLVRGFHRTQDCIDHHAFRSQFGSVGTTSVRCSDLELFQCTLHKRPQHLTPSLQQWVSHYNLQKPLQSFPSVLDHIVREPIREDLAG